jgi:hypothetical protein
MSLNPNDEEIILAIFAHIQVYKMQTLLTCKAKIKSQPQVQVLPN